MTHPYYVILPIEFTAQGDYASKVNTAMIDSRTCQDLMASDGEAKIFFFPPWVFAWNQFLRAQSLKSEMGRKIVSVF